MYVLHPTVGAACSLLVKASCASSFSWWNIRGVSPSSPPSPFSPVSFKQGWGWGQWEGRQVGTRCGQQGWGKEHCIWGRRTDSLLPFLGHILARDGGSFAAGAAGEVVPAVSVPAVCLVALCWFAADTHTGCLSKPSLGSGGRWWTRAAPQWVQPPTCACQKSFARPKQTSVKKMRVLFAFIVCMLTQLALWLILLASVIAFNELKAEVSPHREQSPPGCRTANHQALSRAAHSWELREQTSAPAACTHYFSSLRHGGLVWVLLWATEGVWYGHRLHLPQRGSCSVSV